MVQNFTVFADRWAIVKFHIAPISRDGGCDLTKALAWDLESGKLPAIQYVYMCVCSLVVSNSGSSLTSIIIHQGFNAGFFVREGDMTHQCYDQTPLSPRGCGGMLPLLPPPKKNL